MSCIPYASFQKEKTGDIINLEQFEEGYLLSEYHNGTERDDKPDNDSTPLISEAKMDEFSSSYKFDSEPMSTDMLEYIRDRS